MVSYKKWHDHFLKDLKSHRYHREHTGTLLGYISKRKTFSSSQRRPLLTLGRARRSCFGQSTSRNYCLRCKKLAPNRRSSGRGRGWTRGEEGEDTTGREGGSLSYFDSCETICSALKNKQNIAVNKRMKTEEKILFWEYLSLFKIKKKDWSCILKALGYLKKILLLVISFVIFKIIYEVNDKILLIYDISFISFNFKKENWFLIYT